MNMRHNENDEEICLQCGTILKCRVDRTTVFGVPVPTKREYCEVCCYLEYERLVKLCPCPHKTPMPRLTRDGHVPQIVLDQIAKAQRDLAGVKPLF